MPAPSLAEPQPRPGWVRRIVMPLLRSVLMLSIFLVACQSRILYHPRSYAPGEVERWDAQRISFTTADGEQAAWLIDRRRTPGQALPSRVWIAFGGNGSVAMDYASFFHDHQLAQDIVLLCDIPGYGSCAGKPKPASVRRTAQAIVPALANALAVSTDELRPRLRVFGHSLGSSAALMTMREHRVPAGVLIAPYTRMLDMARQLVGWPLCELLHHRFDNVAELRAITQHSPAPRLILLHGSQDEVIPQAQGRALAAAFPSMVEFRDAPGGSHNAVLSTHDDLIIAAMLAH